MVELIVNARNVLEGLAPRVELMREQAQKILTGTDWAVEAVLFGSSIYAGFEVKRGMRNNPTLSTLTSVVNAIAMYGNIGEFLAGRLSLNFAFPAFALLGGFAVGSLLDSIENRKNLNKNKNQEK